MVSKGVGSLLFKGDLKHYYRQIFVDPANAVKLRYFIDDVMFIDSTLPMGMTSSCYIAQWVSCIISYIMKQQGYSAVNYIDDLGGVNTPSNANSAFDELGNILAEIGILESVRKTSPPLTKMTFLGILLDSVSQTVSIDSDRLSQIKEIVSLWLSKSTASLQELQCLVGMLSFTATCVHEGHLFFSHILVVLKQAYHCDRQINISVEMQKDLHWWNTSLDDYNGISCIPNEIWSRPNEVFSSDSCLTGCGACSLTHFFHFKLPSDIIKQGRYINQFELYAILIAVREWASKFRNRNILVYCDNQTSVNILCNGCVNCTFMQKCLREIRYHSANFNFRIRAVYLHGEDNRISNSLSRWHLSESCRDEFRKATKNLNLSEMIVSNFAVNKPKRPLPPPLPLDNLAGRWFQLEMEMSKSQCYKWQYISKLFKLSKIIWRILCQMQLQTIPIKGDYGEHVCSILVRKVKTTNN